MPFSPNPNQKHLPSFRDVLSCSCIDKGKEFAAQVAREASVFRNETVGRKRYGNG